MSDLSIDTPPLHWALSELIEKKTSCLRLCDSVTSLVLGSSHGDYGFDPQFLPGSYNFCTISQDLEHALYLYRYMKHRLPKLKNIILIYSFFYTGFELSKCSEKCRCAAFKEVFSLDVTYQDQSIEDLYASIAGQYYDKMGSGTGADWGFIRSNERFFFKDKTVGDRFKQQKGYTLLYENAGKFVNQIPALIRMAELINASGHNLVIAIPPLRSGYTELLPSSDILYKPLYEAKATSPSLANAPILNFHNSPLFTDDDFGDFDHLLPASTASERFARAIAYSMGKKS